MSLSRGMPHPTSGRTALTLLEMMVSVTLLAVIMVGLLSMFQHTQRALHVATTSKDVFENARGAIELVARDLSEMASYEDTNVLNFTGLNSSSLAGTLTWATDASGTLASQPLLMNQAYWLTRLNNDWTALGYYVAEDEHVHGNFGVGTLYRFTQTTNQVYAPGLINYWSGPQSVTTTNHRVSDGVVHFAMQAVRVSNSGTVANPIVNYFRDTNAFEFPRSDVNNVVVSLPAFVDVEIGILEPATLKQYQGLKSLDATLAQQFLRDHAARIHFFRERVPIRNYVNPYRANEVP